MNIFVLDTDIKQCAQMHCDKHVVKMVLETAQLLSTANHINGKWTPSMYKPTHMHHPCTIWTAESTGNYAWLYSLFKWLCVEYTFRYDKLHKCDIKLSGVLMPSRDAAIQPMTPFRQAMPELYKNDNVVKAYRAYYLGDKRDIATWNKTRAAPYWWIE